MIENDIKLLEHCVLDLQHRVQVLEDKIKQTQKSLEQFKVGLEYHTDTTHFGKVKGESITINKIEDEPQIEYDEYCEKIRAHDPHKDW